MQFMVKKLFLQSNKKNNMPEAEDKTPEIEQDGKSTKKVIFEDLLGDESAEFIENNRSVIKIATIVLAVAVLSWFSYSILYKTYVVEPKNEKSLAAIWRQEAAAFDKGDWNSLINGDSLMTFKSLTKVIDDYSGYDGGKLAVYDLGIAYLNTGDYDKAIETLSEVDFDDELIATITLGGIGDAYLQKGDLSNAGSYYEQAYRRKNNELTSPLYMMKLAFTKEMNENYGEAQKLYQELVEKYPTSPLSITAEKYLESLKLGSPVYKPVYQEE